MGAFIFTCPTTSIDVQHWLADDGDDVEVRYEGILCQACHLLHFVNPKTGRLLGDERK